MDLGVVRVRVTRHSFALFFDLFLDLVYLLTDYVHYVGLVLSLQRLNDVADGFVRATKRLIICFLKIEVFRNI